MKITIITGQHLVSNPRVWKEANSLVTKGYQITILNLWYDTLKVEQDKLLLHKDVKIIPGVNLIRSAKNTLTPLMHKTLFKLSLLIKKAVRRETGYILCYGPRTFYKKALALQSDLYICHQETGLLIGNWLIDKNEKVAFDFEDWYSEDYLVSTRPVKLLRKLEEKALRQGRYVSCPSHAMAEALQETYSSEIKPIVIYNSFYKNISEALPTKIPNSLIWFSQVIGPGRGLEGLINALQNENINIELHLLGKIDATYQEYLKSISKTISIIFHHTIPHYELKDFLSKFLIGCALECNQPLSRNTTISNKILQYLEAGLPVLASQTEGQNEIANRCENFVFTYDDEKPNTLKEAFHNFQLSSIKSNEIKQFFNDNLAFENFESVLWENCQKAIESP